MRSDQWRLRGIVTLVLSWALAGCGAPSAPDAVSDQPAFAAGQATTNVTRFDVDFTDFAACTNEMVHWTGTVQIVDHLNVNRGVPLDPEAVQHAGFHQSTRLTGVGETSGGAYTFISSVMQSVQSESPVNSFPTTMTLVVHDRIFGPGGGRPGMVSFIVKLVLNGTGRLVLDRVKFAETCG